ncbi:hypothetical protein V6Z11_D05G421700 [Gossypium hirsutum]
MESHLEKQNGDVLQKSFKEMISTLPRKSCWGLPEDQYQYQSFWFSPPFLQGALSAQQQFQAQPTDIILCSFPRTGTAWDPKDTFVSLYHFIARHCNSRNTQPIQLDEAFELFYEEEQQQGVPENIVKMCSFDNLSGLEVNKTGRHREGKGNMETENNIFFRKGKVGDWKNYLTTEMAQRLDQRTLQQLSSSGLSL